MTPLDTLAPDQRAVLELVLRQGRSYGELSELLAIPEREVRARADAGLRALAGEPSGAVDSGRIADWLLGQQPDAEAERTRAAVARSPDAREWAAKAADRLGELGGAVPSVIGRRKLVWLERPWADSPFSWTANQVAIEVIASAIEANTPPWTSPAGWRRSSRTWTRAVACSSLKSISSSP